MRPAAFTYTRPAHLADALRALAAGAVPLAGDQSLVQAMHLRAATPQAVVDLAGVAELSNQIVGPTSSSPSVRASAIARCLNIP